MSDENLMNIPLDAAVRFQSPMADYAPQAECAPSKAQPRMVVLPNPDTTYSAPWAGHTFKYHSNDQIVEYANACVKAAAPTPERADAEKDAALTNEKIEAAIDGFNLVGDGKSLKELKRLMHEEACAIYLRQRVKELEAQAECAPREAQPVPISDDHAHALYKLANMTGFVGWLNEFRKSIAATPANQERADAEKDAALTDEQIDVLITEHSEWTPQGYAIVDSHRKAFARAAIVAGVSACADAEKDAALTGWAEEISDWITNSEFYIVDVSRGALVALRAAILAANKT